MHLAGVAREWGTTMWDNEHECFRFYKEFIQQLCKVFDCSASGTKATQELSLLQQGTRNVSEYYIEFRTLATSCEWNSKAEWNHFFHGLAEHFRILILC